LYNNDEDEDEDDERMNVDDVNLEEGSSDSNEDVIFNFIDDVSNMVV